MRLLRADEVDARIATVKKNGVSLLLYKDARVDQRILDETYGEFGWQRHHELIGDRLYCTISIWDAEKGQWIEKQDVGVESYTEKEKGQASDSFKRAGFNWGIGRELYTAPFIWVGSDKCKIEEYNGKNTCYDRFKVVTIDYDADRNISKLEIINAKTGAVVYKYDKDKKGKPAKKANKQDAEGSNKRDAKEVTPEDKINGVQLKAIRERLKHAAENDRVLTEEALCDYFDIKKLEDITLSQLHIFNDLMTKAGV